MKPLKEGSWNYYNGVLGYKEPRFYQFRTIAVSANLLPNMISGVCAMAFPRLRLKVGTKVKGLRIGDPRDLWEEVEYLGSSKGKRGVSLPKEIAQAARTGSFKWLAFRYVKGGGMLYVCDSFVALAKGVEVTLPLAA